MKRCTGQANGGRKEKQKKEVGKGSVKEKLTSRKEPKMDTQKWKRKKRGLIEKRKERIEKERNESEGRGDLRGDSSKGESQMRDGEKELRAASQKEMTKKKKE